jgi:O-antigen/teichoic acid export membrane protein
MVLLLSSIRQPLLHAMGIHGEHARIVAWLFPITGALSVYMFVIEALNASVAGLGRMDLSNYLDCVARITGVAISATLLFQGWGIAALPMGTFCTYFIMHAAVIRILRAQLRIPVFRLRHWSLHRMKSLLRFGGGMLSASALGMLVGPLNKAFISRYLGLGAVPTYELAYSAATQFRSVGEAGVRALMPEVSRLGSRLDAGSRKAIWALNRRGLILIVALGLPVFLTVFAGSGILLEFWLGSRATVELQQSFRIMIAGTFLGLLGTPCYYTLVGLGNVRAVMQTYAALAVTNVATIGIGLTMLKMSVALAATGCALGMGAGTACVILAATRLTFPADPASGCSPRQCLLPS